MFVFYWLLSVFNFFDYNLFDFGPFNFSVFDFSVFDPSVFKLAWRVSSERFFLIGGIGFGVVGGLSDSSEAPVVRVWLGFDLKWVVTLVEQFADQKYTGPGPIESAGSSSTRGRSIDKLLQLAALATATPLEVLGLSFFGGAGLHVLLAARRLAGPWPRHC